MPIFRPAPAVQQEQYVQPARQIRQPQRTSRNDIYLPAMPEMMQPANQSSPTQFAQNPQALNQPTAALAAGRGTKAVRGQADDGGAKPIAKLLPPAPLEMPSPEELGVANSSAKVAKGADWTTARARLDQLGAAHYRFEKSADGTFHFSCAFPKASDPAQQKQFVAQGRSEQEAIGTAMLQVEEWSAVRN